VGLDYWGSDLGFPLCPSNPVGRATGALAWQRVV